MFLALANSDTPFLDNSKWMGVKNSRVLEPIHGKSGVSSKQPCLLLNFYLVSLGKCPSWPSSGHWGRYLSRICVDEIPSGWVCWSTLWNPFTTLCVLLQHLEGPVFCWAYSGYRNESFQELQMWCLLFVLKAVSGGTGWNKQQSCDCSEGPDLLGNL